VLWVDDQPVPVSVLAETLAVAASEPSKGPTVVLADISRRTAFRSIGW
jgi:hypothetical protein